MARCWSARRSAAWTSSTRSSVSHVHNLFLWWYSKMRRARLVERHEFVASVDASAIRCGTSGDSDPRGVPIAAGWNPDLRYGGDLSDFYLARENATALVCRDSWDARGNCAANGDVPFRWNHDCFKHRGIRPKLRLQPAACRW